jgi:hypothetical protein
MSARHPAARPRRPATAAALLVLLAAGLLVPAPAGALRVNGCHDFTATSDGFSKLNDQPYSELGHDLVGGRVSLVSDRQDGSDEQFVIALNAQLRPNKSFSVTGKWATTQQGNWQNAFPLFLAPEGTQHVREDGGAVGVQYRSQDSNLGEQPFYTMFYRDASGTLRMDQEVRLQVDTEYHFVVQFDKRSGELSVHILDAADQELAQASYVVGSSAGDGFAFDLVGAASRGSGEWSEPRVEGWVDDICVRNGNGGLL